MRVDNGAPWGTSSRPVPSALALWLSGLGIDMVYGRRAVSTDNAIVERCHGVLEQWVDPLQQANWGLLAQRLEWAAETQRERYRSPHHLTRAQAFPDLYTNTRTYHRQQDAHLWDVEQAADFLATYTFYRKVEKNGRINLLANTYSVGRDFARQNVTVRLDARAHEWLILDDYGNLLVRHPSKELDYETLYYDKLGQRRTV